jgi:hypothetical protein
MAVNTGLKISKKESVVAYFTLTFSEITENSHSMLPNEESAPKLKTKALKNMKIETEVDRPVSPNIFIFYTVIIHAERTRNM